jgi:photosystem II stability/assembly factor-like uncharacterized protein
MLVDQQMLGSMEWRLVGPFRGGRVPAVVGHPTELSTFFFGACAGGVWKTTDGGDYWENVSDGYFNVAAVGALAIADSDPNVIYAGTGETQIRSNVSHGDGVYKSTDGGKTWSHCGLKDSHAIGAIRVHPQNADVLYVAALGHVWGTNEERGIFRSKDGGKSWEKVLYRSPNAGAIDLTMDPNNPRILYAAFWDAQRYPHALRSGGPDSSIYKTTDGGDTWTEITRNPGLPKGVMGKIGITASPAQTDRVWALIEAEDGALFRSDDGGDTWERVCEQGDLRRRAWYYTHVFADPSDADTVWVLNLKCWKSVDGGKTFTAIPTPHGDNQDLWIDPKNSNRMIEGNDGGANVTYNGGRSWSSIYNQPTAQFYHVTTDNRVPYYLYGSQQDNTALAGPSSSQRGAITLSEWFQPGGGESGYIAVKPTDENIVFGGAIGSGAGNGRLIKYDRRTNASAVMTVWPEVQGMGRGAEDLKYRFQWTFPIVYSGHDGTTLYVTSNVVHRSTDDGMSWEVISPDLTHNDPETQKPSGGPITRDNTGAEAYNTIFAFVESPHERGFFWAGSDDGRIHTSEGGKEWTEVSIPRLERALISVIELSPHDAATAYVAATRYKFDDFTPYLYKTTDYGRTWTKITNGIPDNDFTRVIREDPQRKGLLYAGTETGVYVSFDDGENWTRFNNNLPVVPIHDLHVKGTDLVAATHGRSFWILDDLTPLHQVSAEMANQPVTLLKPRSTKRFRHEGRAGDPGPLGVKSYGRFGGMMGTSYQRKGEGGENEITFLDAGKNPPDGVVIHYWLKEAPKGQVTLTVKDSHDRVLRRFTSNASASTETTDTDAATLAAGAEGAEGASQPQEPVADLPSESKKVPAKQGMNRFVWDMRMGSARAVEGLDPSSAPMSLSPDMLVGPTVVPGTYRIELAVNGQTQTQEVEIEADPRVSASAEDLQAQFDLLMQIREQTSKTNQAINRVRTIRAQVEDWSKRVDDQGVRDSAATLKGKLDEIETALIQPDAGSPLMKPSGLVEKLVTLPGMISTSDTRPAQQYYEVFEKLTGEIDEQIAALDAVIANEVKAFNDAVRNADVVGIRV